MLILTSGSGLTWFPLLLVCSVILSTLLVVLADPGRIDEEFPKKLGFPTFAALEVSLPRLTGVMLAEVVHREDATAGCLDGWGWREFKASPVSWFDGLASIFSKVEDTGVWPEGLLDVYIAMIPQTDGDATPLGQRPLSVLPIVYRTWASVRMLQLEEWFRSRVPDSVFKCWEWSQFC